MDTETTTIPEIAIADRCDRCGAQAFVATRIPHPEGITTLYWCGHHYRHHETALTHAALDIRDQRDTINTAASTSAY